MITNFENLPRLREEYSDSIAFCSGCFDLLHTGHLEGLEFARSQASLLVVGIQPDVRTREMKGPSRPIQAETSRMMLINSLRIVGYTFLMPPRRSDITPTMRVLKALQPDVFVIHEENATPWTFEDIESLRNMGTEFVVDHAAKRDSTSAIIGRIITLHGQKDS